MEFKQDAWLSHYLLSDIQKMGSLPYSLVFFNKSEAKNFFFSSNNINAGLKRFSVSNEI